MGLRSLFFETSNSPRACFKWAIAILVPLVFLLWDSSSCNLKTDGPIIKLQNKATLCCELGEDTIEKVLPSNDSVRVLAINYSHYGQKWLVKTTKGDIGWIDAFDLKGIKQIVTNGENKGDTITISGVGTSVMSMYVYVDRKGKEHELGSNNFVPVIDKWNKYVYNAVGVAGVCSKKKFETICRDKEFKKINKRFGSPVLLSSTSKGFKAAYAWKVYDKATGNMLEPFVTFSNDSIVREITFACPTDRAASWLKRIPFASLIIDCPLTSFVIRGNRYEYTPNPMVLGWGWAKALYICLLPFIIFAYLAWMFLASSLPVLMMGWLVKFPKIFFLLSDRSLKWIMRIFAIISAYTWSVMMMAWGMFAIFFVIIVLVSYYTFILASSPLCRFPHLRCPQCRRLYTIRFDISKLEKQEIKKGTDIVRDKLLGTRTEKWKAWTQVTTSTVDSYGRVTTGSYKKDVHTKARNYNTYLFIDYDVTYRLDYYRDYYKCRCCGFVENGTSVKSTELSRKKVGLHTAEIPGEIYRTRR